MRYSSFILLFLSAALCTTRLTAQNNAAATAAQNAGAPDAVGSTLTLPQAVAIAIKNNLLVNQADLTAKGLKFTRYPYFEQSPDGVWSAPGGAKVAWFADPDGNTLSLSQH